LSRKKQYTGGFLALLLTAVENRFHAFSIHLSSMILDKVHVFVYFAIVKTISFYRTASGNCPVEEHLNNLTDAEATKIA